MSIIDFISGFSGVIGAVETDFGNFSIDYRYFDEYGTKPYAKRF
jgi:hypothetical protein